MSKTFIACFDSGIGGITTLAAARALLPAEDFVYFADTAHTPYGGRPRGQVLDLTRAAVRELQPLGLKALLMACNTATAAAAAELRAELDMPVLGLEPAIKPALAATDGLVVALGTELTVRGEKFRNLLAALPQAPRVAPVACPGLVELIEQDTAQPAVAEYLRRVLAPYEQEMQALVLGCTHYVFLRPVLKKLYPQLMLFDGNEGVSRHLARMLQEQSLPGAAVGTGQLLWRCSEPGQQAQQRFAGKCAQLYQLSCEILQKNDVND